MKKTLTTQYVLLLVLQIIIMAIFFVYCRYSTTSTTTAEKSESKSNDNSRINGFMDIHVMIFVGFGFLMTFLKKYCHSALGLNLMLAALAIQLALIGTNVYKMENNTIQITKKSLLEADVMAATVLITFGAILGLASAAQLMVITVFEIVFACLNFYLIEKIYKASDVGGSIAIHTFGAYFGLGVSLALSIKRTKNEADRPSEDLNGPSYTSDVTAMIGSIFLWIYWPSFNAALCSTETEYERALTNTYLSLAACTITTFALSAIVNHQKGKFDMVHIQNSTLAGGVAVGSVCNMFVQPGGAIAVGMGAAIISVVGYRYLTPRLDKLGIRDTCGVNNLHGMPGVYSGILSAIFALLASSDLYSDSDLKDVFPGRDDRSASQQALYQFVALVGTILLSFMSGLFVGGLTRLPIFTQLKDNEYYNDDLYWQKHDA